MKRILFLITALLMVSPCTSQDLSSQSPILFIYDASGSMWGQMQGKTKMEIAAEVLSTSVNSLPQTQKIGFVAYGHRNEGDCRDVEFMVDEQSGTRQQVVDAVSGIKPLGKTPLAYSAQLVIDKLRQAGTAATIILITDGIESCDGDICQVVEAAKAEGIEFKLHIIGFGLKNEDTRQLECASRAGGGNYFNAEDAAGLGEVLSAATQTTVDEPDANFSVYAVKNGEPIDAVVRAYDAVAKRRPILVRTYRDTAHFYLPPSSYTFEATPLEGSDVNPISLPGIESLEGQSGHRTISFDAGKVGITTTNNGENWDCVVKLYGQDGKVAASVRTYTAPKEVEVDPGTYKVTIQALAMEGMETYSEIENVQVGSGGITPVAYEFSTGHFQLYTRVGDENIDTVVKINELATGTNVAGARTYTKGAKFLLNPGIYEVSATPLGVHKDKAAQTLTVEIKQGETTTKSLSF